MIKLLTIALLIGQAIFCTSLVAGTSAKVFEVQNVSKSANGKAADFQWKDGGSTYTFSKETKGKVVLLNIWATWCGPCKREIPDLIEISKEMADKGVVVVGVSVDQNKNATKLVSNYVEKTNIPYLMFVSLEISEAYGGILSIPTTFIIDRTGKVVQKIVGMQSKAQFEQALKAAM